MGKKDDDRPDWVKDASDEEREAAEQWAEQDGNT